MGNPSQFADNQAANLSTTSSSSNASPQPAESIPNSPLSDFEHLSNPSSSRSISPKARLLYCKSHVSIHPTQFNKDNIRGYLALVESDSLGAHAVKLDAEGNVGNAGRHGDKKEVIVTWVPDEVLQRMDQEDRDSFKRVDERNLAGHDAEEDGMLPDVPLLRVLTGRLRVRLDAAT